MTTLFRVQDPVSETLDDMAALGQSWAKAREAGRTPNGIRGAMLIVARELIALEELSAAPAHEWLGQNEIKP